MSLSQARQYLVDRIQEISPDRVEHIDPFNNENIPDNLLDTSFHISIQPTSSLAANDIVVQDQMTTVVTIFTRANRSDLNTKFDALLDEAQCIKLNVVNQNKVAKTDNIESIEPVSILPEAIDVTNDNTFKMSIQFNIRLFFRPDLITI